MSVQEAADALGISRRGVLSRIERGEMQAQRIGSRVWLISRSEIERWRGLGKLRPGPKRGTHRKTSDSSASE